MVPFKLKNNTGVKSEANICFANSTLQVLFTIPEFRDLFKNRRYRLPGCGKLPISNELSRIFNFSGQSSTSAAVLRSLVGKLSKKPYLCDGSHQDILEFIETFLDELEKELAEVSSEAISVLDGFCGTETEQKKFLETPKGCCQKCGYIPITHSELFKSMKLFVKDGTHRISLNDLIEQNYSEQLNILKMKCSKCNDNTIKDATSSRLVSKSPQFLLVSLIKFQAYNGRKVNMIVEPPKELLLPNGNRFHLLAIADHLGEYIHSGHYTASVRLGHQWFRCDDEKIILIDEKSVINKHNYILLYYRNNDQQLLPQNQLFSITDKFQSNKNDSPDKKCKQCSKTFKNLWLHLKKSDLCQPYYDMHEVESIHKYELREKQTDRKRKWRSKKDETSKKLDNEKAKMRMQVYRKSMDDASKKVETEKARERMMVHRQSMDDAEKQVGRENDKKRKKDYRESMDDASKQVETVNARERMMVHRKSMDDARKQVETEKARGRMMVHRESMDEPRRKIARTENIKHQKNHREKRLLENPYHYRLSVAQNKANSRRNQVDTVEGRRKIFLQSVKHGPIFGCVSCHRSCFDNCVISLPKTFADDLEKCHPGLFKKAIGSMNSVRSIKGNYHLCFTCKSYLHKGKIPPMSHKNNLGVFDVSNNKELILSEIEQCTIARNLLFMKMHQLPKSRMAGVKDKLVNVPVHEEDVMKTIKSFPRTPHESGVIPIKLKRKKEYKNTHKEEYISIPKIMAALRTLKSLGHKYYQFIATIQEDKYKEKCESMDNENKNSQNEEPVSTTNIDNEQVDDDDADEKEIHEMLQKDPMLKYQFDYNNNTCFLNNVPEISLSENDQNGVTIAPGEGKVPKNILQDKDWDMRAFPILDPTGNNSLNCKRDVRLSAQQFFQQRIFNINPRFANCPSFVFAATQYIENKQLTGNINIAFNRGKATKTEDGGTMYRLHDPSTVLDNIKGTPRYFRKKKNEFIAKLENIGPFQFFFTLSCADARYEENFTALLQDHHIEYIHENGKDICKIDGQPLNEFLSQHESKHEFIRQNILTATRNFDHRVKNFIKTIIMSKHNDMHVGFYNYRVEFQMRGAPHIHGVLWLDFKAFCADARNQEFNNVEEILNGIGNEMPLLKEQESLLAKFCDKFITCTLKDPETKEIVKEVNIHSHTKSCRKYGGSACRFNYPKFPVDETLIAVPAKIKFQDEKEREEMLAKAKYVLSKVKDVLIDEDAMKEIEDLYPLSDELRESKYEIQIIQRRRLIELLKKADISKRLGVNKCTQLPDDLQEEQFNSDILHEYKELLKISMAGYKIVLKRGVDEIYVNNYNKEWIMCWNSNMDIQLTLDHFAIITYISDYMLKDDTGTMEFIIRAIKDTENLTLKERLKAVKNTFLTHRQIGEAEAYYRLIPSLHLSGSNCATLYIHTGFLQNRSVFLKAISKEDAKKLPKTKLVTISDRPDKYFTQTVSVEDRYDNRPDELKQMSLAQFAKRLTRTSKLMSDEDDDLFEDGTEVVISEEDQLIEEESLEDSQDINSNTVIALDKQHRIPLKKTYKCDGTYMRLRKPLVLRFHKYKQTTDPHQYYFSQLRLFHPHSLDELKIWQNDLDKCLLAFKNAKDSIRYVKSKVMKYQEKVEEAQEKAQEEFDNCVGDIIDAAKEQEQDDCRIEGTHEPDAFLALDPDNFESSVNSSTKYNDSYFKKIELQELSYICSETRKLDPDQRQVIDIGVEFAQNLKKCQNNKHGKPVPPLIVVHAGAGCGKSFVINLMTQWQERILRTAGDDPSHPYILKCAFTGTAASIIEGQTLHHAFSFSFGNEFYSLSDKVRDDRRRLLKNLKIVVIDEFSMVKSDMLYQLDLRLKELKEVYDQPFGGVSIFLFGDLLQLRPTAAKYIFDDPTNEQFRITHAIESLWEQFKVVNLTYNHRQGNDKSYADILNRIRVGEMTDEDISILHTRVMDHNDPKLPKDAIYISAVNEDVSKVNEARLDNLNGPMLTINSVITNKTLQKYKPTITNAGTIKNTPLQNILRVKVGAKVILTYNIDTSDGLTNGALGEIVGYDMVEGRVQIIYVEFNDKKIGRNKRMSMPQLQNRFPGRNATPINKLEFAFGQSKKAYSTSSQATALQFPLKLAWAITAHKIQGQTIKKPNMLIADLSRVFEAAQAYVILSRIQDLNQLVLLGDVFSEKIYPSSQAIAELENMRRRTYVSAKTHTENRLKLVSLNIRSIRSHFADLFSEPQIRGSDLVLLQQTCLEKNENTNGYSLPNMSKRFISIGNGKGLALYYTEKFSVVSVFANEQYQIAKIQSDEYDVISVYRSSDSNQRNKSMFSKQVLNMVNNFKKTVIVGDFNCSALKNKEDTIVKDIEHSGFTQLVQLPTQVQGGLIDHIYVSHLIEPNHFQVRQKPVYYTDHDILEIMIEQ